MKKRRRTLLSCFNCHARKQKCDRRWPCNNCMLRHVEESCQFMDQNSIDPQAGVPVSRITNTRAQIPPRDTTLPRCNEKLSDCLLLHLHDLPDQDTCRKLFSIYFSSMADIYPYINRSELEHDTQLLWSITSTHREKETFVNSLESSLMLSTVVLAITMVGSPEYIRVQIGHPIHRVDKLAMKAYNFSYHCQSHLSDPHDPENKQITAMVLLASMQKIAGRAYIAKQHSANAVALAVRAGLHLNRRTGHETSEKWLELDRQERLWWISYQIDRTLSFLLSRPPALRYDQITLLAPRNVNVYGGPEQGATCMTLNTHAILGRRYSEILDLVDEVVATSRKLTSETPRMVLLRHIDHELDYFEQTLPDSYSARAISDESQSLCQSSVQIEALVPFSRHIVLSYLYTTKIAINRPLLANLSGSLNPSSDTLESICNCINAAIIQINFQLAHNSRFLDAPDEYLVVAFANAYFLFDPATTLLSAISTLPSHQELNTWCRAVDGAEQMLLKLSRINEVAAKSYQVLLNFESLAKVVLAKAGKTWPCEISSNGSCNVRPFMPELPSAGKINQSIPFHYLGTVIHWDFDLSRQAPVTQNSVYQDEYIGSDNVNTAESETCTSSIFQADVMSFLAGDCSNSNTGQNSPDEHAYELSLSLMDLLQDDLLM